MTQIAISSILPAGSKNIELDKTITSCAVPLTYHKLSFLKAVDLQTHY